jgi:hypothetical protein
MRFVNSAEAKFNHSVIRTCVSCGNEFAGRYCNRCGEEVIEVSDKSFAHALVSALRTMFSIENRFVRTALLMVRNTGQYSSNYIKGVRAPFVRPVAIFLLVNLLYFIFPVYETFNAPLRTQMHFLPHSKFAKVMVDERIQTEGTTLGDFTIRYEQHSYSLSRMMLILFVFLAALPIGFINYSSNLYFADHLTVSFEFNTLLIFLTQLVLPWIFTLLNHLGGLVGFDISFLLNGVFYAVIVILSSILLFYLFETRIYSQADRIAWFRSVLIAPGLFIALEFYRGILFYVTMLTL